MKYPLDRICIKSGILCPSCQRKVEANVVSQDEIDVMRALMELEDKLKFLKNGEYVKSLKALNQAIVIVRGEFEPREIEQVEKELSDMLGTKAKVVIETGDPKKLIEQIIAPASLLGINKVWLPGGSEIINVRISRRDRKYLGKRIEEYEELLTKMLGSKTQIVFE